MRPVSPGGNQVWTMAAPDERRFTALYLAHYADVVGYLLRRTGRDDALDAAAEVFVVAWRRLDDVPDPPLPWLYGVAARTLANQRRGNRRRAALDGKLRGLARRRSPAPDVEVIQRESDRVVIDAVNSMSAADRELLLLNAWEGLPASQLASRFGISLKAAEKRVTRARARLGTALQEAETSLNTSSTTPRAMEEGGRQ